MSLNPLDNPLERLGVLPNGMNWRGGWLVSEQYYLNDVVISPLTTASFILNGKTTLLGGADPSLNPDWIELSNPTTGVVSVNAGVGITITGTGSNPIVNNDGILTFTAGTGVNNTGTATNPIINNTGVLTCSAGTGISITGTTNPIITNDGIRTLTAGAGVSVSAGNNPIVANTGILGITAGSGLSSTGGQTPTLAVSTSLQPKISQIFYQLNVPAGLTPSPVPPTSTGSIVVILNSPTMFATQLATTGTPDPNGSWLIDLSSWNFILTTTPVGLNRIITFTFVDNTTAGGPFTYSPNVGGIVRFQIGANVPSFNLGQVVFDMNVARGTGMRTIDEIVVNNTTGADLYMGGWNDVIATYYPQGVQ